MVITQEIVDRFNSKWIAVPESGCWLWTSALIGSLGYGGMKVHGKMVSGHRLSWQIHFGEIPTGMCVLHRCDVPSCVNKSHLWLGTVYENNADRDLKGRHRTIRGSDHPSAKLNNEEVRIIRSSSDLGIDLAKRFGVCEQTITNVRRNYKYVRVN